MRLHHSRDVCAGGLMILIGLGAVIQGRRYAIGSLREMGPGYFPIAIGLLLALLGAMIAASALAGHAPQPGEDMPVGEGAAAAAPDLRGGACILLGMTAFILLGRCAGLVPATFAAVFIAALGDRHSSLVGSAILGACVTAAGVLLFSYLLKVPFPLFGGS
jgi:hypothetical protein